MGTAHTAEALLQATAAELAPHAGDNPFVPKVEQGTASRAALAALALEQHHVIASDQRAFAHLAERSTARGESACAAFFGSLADGEEIAAGHLDALSAALGLDAAAIGAYETEPGCQAYPSYVARLALTARPPEAVLALSANFAAWGGYCARISGGLRAHYGLGEEARAFFDFFAAPAPDLDEQAVAAVRAGLDSGLDVAMAYRSGRLLQSYESMFWSTLAERP
ncbi:transcriptional regulator [Streptomyces monticola]|uniref:Transcriptional regulator n=1 Tax=Streptomyces monticola TaxID=2666263 RepID=A0ABW2JAC7_9ACTN